MRSRKAIINIVVSLIFQLVTVISGLILPRMIIGAYGSETNGIVTSITQFLSYISLLEAGVSGVINAALYKPIFENDMASIGGIVKAAQSFYKKIAKFFLVYCVILACTYSLIVKTEFDWLYIVSLTLILSVGTFLQYYFSLAYVSLISSDQNLWLISSVNGITLVLNLASTLVLIGLGCEIRIVKIVSSLIFAIKPLIFTQYVKKHYQFPRNIQEDHSAIKQRWNGLAHHICYFIHSNTDIVIISVVLGVKMVSVYAVYFAIVSGIERLITSFSGGIAAGIGNVIVEGKKETIDRVVDLFEFVQTGLTIVLYTISAMMLPSFIKLYTNGIVDVNYIQPVFGYLLISAEAVYCIRIIYSTISLNANRYKQTQAGAIAEAAVNVVVSIVLVVKLGLIGVALGTLVAMITRCIFDVVYLSKHLLYRSINKFLNNIVVNISVSIVSIFLCKTLIQYDCISWTSWIVEAVYSSIITVGVAVLFWLVFRKDQLRNAISMMIAMFKRKEEINHA